MAHECRTAREMMHEALDGELTAPARRRFERHLAACPACRRAYDALAGAVAALEAAPRLEPSPVFAAGVMRRVRLARARQAAARRLLSWATAGAAAAVAAGTAAFWGRVFGPALGAAASSWAADAVRVAADGWRLIRALGAPASAGAKVASALGTAGLHVAREAVQAASPAYLGAFVAVTLFYLIWRLGSRAAAPSRGV
jgi:anti-sigma factor RsiW